MSRSLNFVYEYEPSATKGPVITLAADQVETTISPNIIANVPIANMCSLFQFEDVDIDNNSLKDQIISGSSSVANNSRNLRLDFTPLEQVILGIERKLAGEDNFSGDGSASVEPLTKRISSASFGGSELLNKLPAAALISREVGDIQLGGFLTDILNSGPTYYDKSQASAPNYNNNHSAIRQLFGQAVSQGMLLFNKNGQQEIELYNTINIGFPACKVNFESGDFLDITIKYKLSANYQYKIQSTLGSTPTSGTFKIAGMTFTLVGGVLQNTNDSQGNQTDAIYKIRFVASDGSSVFNISDSVMSAKYNTALVNLLQLYNNTGYPNGYNFNLTSPFPDKITNPTFFPTLKSVTDNLKYESGNTTTTLATLGNTTANSHLLRSVFLRTGMGARLPPLADLNAFIEAGAASSPTITNANLYVIQYTVLYPGNNEPNSVSSVKINDVVVADWKDTVLIEPFLAITFEVSNGSSTLLYASNESGITINDSEGIIGFFRGSSDISGEINITHPDPYSSSTPPDVYTDGDILTSNIVNLGMDFYLVVDAVTAAPDPNELEAGYIRFIVPEDQTPVIPNLYVVTYTVTPGQNQGDDDTISNLSINDDLNAPLPKTLASPFLLIIAGANTTESYYVGKQPDTILTDVYPNVGFLGPYAPQGTVTINQFGQNQIPYELASGVSLENNIVEKDSEYYLVVDTVIAAPTTPLEPGYVKFQMPVDGGQNAGTG